MTKDTASSANPTISLDHGSAAPLYRQVYERLRLAILTGRIEPGARLPSTRALASELGVSRTTTTLAYEQLQMEGYIESRVGDGARVAQLTLEHGAGDVNGARATATPGNAVEETTRLSQRGQALVSKAASASLFHVDDTDTRSGIFRAGVPDVSSFPWGIWATLVARRARRSLPDYALYQDARGYAPLREAIATHIGVTRGVRCSPEQIIITAGAQGALDLVARVLLDRGDTVCVEDPGYPGSRGAIMGAGARPTPVPVDGEGLVVEVARQRGENARMAIVSPSHQFPTAVTMSLTRRLALLEWATSAGTWVIEDDYDSEFRYSGRPLEALQALDRSRRVVYVGTFSKVMFPALRLGYLVAPPDLLAGLLAARRLVDVHPPLLEQLALADFLTEGHFARHIRRMRDLYRERRDALVDALAHDLGGLLDVTTPEAGLHLVGWLPVGTDARPIIAAAAERQLYLSSVSQFSVRALPRDGLHLGFASASPDALRAGVRTLARCAETFGR
jgi:GntR family transcriptional regulator/MocR family aminotransferase